MSSKDDFVIDGVKNSQIGVIKTLIYVSLGIGLCFFSFSSYRQGNVTYAIMGTGGFVMYLGLMIFLALKRKSRSIFRVGKEVCEIYLVSDYFPSFGNGRLIKSISFEDIIEIRIARKSATGEWFLILHSKGDKVKMNKDFISKFRGENAKEETLNAAKKVCSLIDHLDFE